MSESDLAAAEIFDLIDGQECDRCGAVYDEAAGASDRGLCPSCTDATEAS